MKYSALMLFVFVLMAVPLSAMQDLYLDFFSADNCERDVYDTNAWGVRTWDERYQLWRYEKNITVQHIAEYDQIIQTVITFSHYEPIVLFGEWQDKRFVESQGSTIIEMTNDSITAQKWANAMNDLCQRFNAYAQYDLLDSYDTKPWGNCQWDDRYNYWEYELGVTVEPRAYEHETIVTFPGYDPIQVSGVDKRFAAPSSSSTTAVSSSSMSVSTSSVSSSPSSTASSFIKRLHDKYMKDQFVDEAAWGNTKQYNDDLTAYTYLETGIRVDLRLGVVTFPGFQGSLPLPEHMVIRTKPSQHSTQSAPEKVGLFANIRSTVATLCVAAFMWCLHPES